MAGLRAGVAQGRNARLAPSDAGRVQRLNAEANDAKLRERNANKDLNQVRAYDATAAEVESQLFEIIELAIRASSDTLSTQDRTSLEKSLDASLESIDRLAQDAALNPGTGSLNASQNFVPPTAISFSTAPSFDLLSANANAETITITALSASTFSVVGSVSGQFANGTAGVSYTTGAGSNQPGSGLQFTIDDSRPLWIGDTIEFEVTREGTFNLTATELPPGEPSVSRSVALGDFDGDGDIDWVESGGELYRNDGSGNFSSEELTVLNDDAEHLAALHFNGDGNLDLVETAGSSLERYRFYLGDGAGGFTVQSTVFSSEDLLHDSEITVSDFNGDGFDDFVIGAEGGIVVTLSDGAGGFGTEQLIGPNDGTRYHGVQVGDLDGDGLTDIVSTNGTDLLRVELDGAGGFDTPSQHTVSAHNEETIAIGDVNGDGYDDIVTGGANPGVRFSNASGLSVSIGTTIAGLQSASGNFDLLDLDADGDLDLLSVTDSAYEIYTNDGAGSFALAQSVTPNQRTILNNHEIRAADLDGDGAREVVIGSWPHGVNSDASVILDTGLELSINAGATSLAPAGPGPVVDSANRGTDFLVPRANLTSLGLGLHNTSLGTPEDAQSTLRSAQRALDEVSIYRTYLGASMGRMEVHAQTFQAQANNTVEASGNIEALDFTTAVANLATLETVSTMHARAIQLYQRTNYESTVGVLRSVFTSSF